MKAKMVAQQFHLRLIKELLASSPTEREVLCLMVLLLSCTLVLSSTADMKDRVRGFAPITSSHVAEIVAKLFPDGERAHYEYWLVKWLTEWKGDLVIEVMPEELKGDLREMLSRIEAHPWIERLEDDGLDVIQRLRS